MTTYQLTIEVTDQVEAEMTEAMEYLRDRVVGEIPDVLTRLAQRISRTWWEGIARDGVALQIVGADGEPLPEPVEESPEELARCEDEVRALVEWENSPEGRAEIDRQDRLAAWSQKHQAETERLYREWLEEQADAFGRAKRDWDRSRQQDLHDRFEAREHQFHGGVLLGSPVERTGEETNR